MSDFKAKITAELDTSGIQSQVDKIEQNKLKLSVDTSDLRSQIEKSLQSPFKIKVSSDVSNKGGNSTKYNNASSAGLTAAQLRQIEAVRRKSQIRTSEFEKKSNLRVSEAKLKNIDKLETAQKASDIRVREAQHKQDIKDMSRRERERAVEARKIQREQEKINKLTNPDYAQERVYGATYRNAYDRSLANGNTLKSAQNAGLNAVKVEKMHEFGDALDNVTRVGARYVALPIAAATVASVKAFMDYETAFTGVRKTVDGTDEELQALSDGIEEMALRVPVASVELANIAKIGGQLGVPTESLLKFVEAFAGLESATNLQGEEGASTLARFMNVVGEDFDNVQNIGSAIVDLGNHFATTELEITSMAQRLGSTGAIVGMSTADVLGYSTALSSLGISAEMGGSAMTRVWQNIARAVSGGGDDLNAFAKISKVTAKDFAKMWKDDPTKAFNSILKGLNESSDIIAELDALGVKNVRDVQSMQKLAERYDLVAEALGRSNTAYEENVALSNEANRAYSTTASKLQLAKESIVQAGRSVGEALAPTVIDMAGGVQSVATGFANLNDGTKKAVVNFALTTAGSLLTANAFAKTVKTVADVKDGFSKLGTFISPLVTKLLPGLAGKGGLAGVASAAGTALAPVLAVGAAVAAVGVAAYQVKKHTDNLAIGATLEKDTKKIKEHTDRVAELNSLTSEVEALELIINTPTSSQEQIDQAKKRLEEIAALVNEKYELNISADTNELKTTLSLLSNQQRGEVVRDVEGFVSKLDKVKYSDAKKSYQGQKKKVDDLTDIYYNLEKLVDRRNIISDTDDSVEKRSDMYKVEKEISDYYKKIEGMGYGDLVRDASDQMYGADLLDIAKALSDAEKDFGKSNTTIGNFENNAKSAIDGLAKALTSDAALGDNYGISHDTALFKSIGAVMKEAGASTDYLAQKYAIAAQGATDLNSAIDSGNLDAVVEDYLNIKKAIGETADDAVRGAALLKQGWTDASQVTSKDINALYRDMKQLGQDNGVSDYVENAIEGTAMLASGFNNLQEVIDSGDEGITKFLSNVSSLNTQEGIFTDDMDIKSKSEQLTELAHSIGLIPEDKSVKIDVETGDISIVDDMMAKIRSAEGKGFVIGVEVEGDISTLTEAQKKILELDGRVCKTTYTMDGSEGIAVIDGIEYKLKEIDGTTGKATIIAEGGEAVGVIDLVNGKIELLPASKTTNVDANVTGTDDVENLDTTIEGVESKDVVVTASTSGEEKVSRLKTLIERIKSKTVDIIARVFGGGDVDGTAHVDGTAFADGNIKHGDWGKKGSGTALGGELGEELVVRDGKFFTIGSDSAEFFTYKKGDIIFNADQTEQIFEKGKITHGKRRGLAMADGNAPAGHPELPIPDIVSSSKGSSKGSSKYEDPTEAIIDRINLRTRELQQEEKYIKNGIEIARIEKDYEKQISLTNNLLNDQRQILDALIIANTELHAEAEQIRNSNPWDEESWFDSQGKATEAYYDLYNSSSEEQQEQIKGVFESLSKYKQAYMENADAILSINKEILQSEEDIVSLHEEVFDSRVGDIEHARDMALKLNPYLDTTSFYNQLQDEYHNRAEYLRALDPEKYKEEIQELQSLWWEAQDSIVEAREKAFNKAIDFGSEYLQSKKTLLESYYDVTNSIAEAQHEINKELAVSQTMYEYHDEDTRRLLFNQEDYNTLSDELLDIQYEADKLKRQYERRLDNATLETLESITSEYQMQYETLMKHYEIAKADLEIAKKKQKLNNVLNERNVRMFIDGKWQWVANTKDVETAMGELADAEYAKRVEEAGLEQKQSIDNLTRQQDALSLVVKNFTGGVIDLDTAVDDIVEMFGELPSVISEVLNKNSSKISFKSGGNGSSNVTYGTATVPGVGKVNVTHVDGKTQTHLPIDSVVHTIGGDYRITGGTAGNYTSEKIEEYATGTKYTNPSISLMGEDGAEMFINSNGHLIPINQPTIGSISAGGIVFNQSQMSNLRDWWDLSNVGVASKGFINRNNQSNESFVFSGDINVYNPTDAEDVANNVVSHIVQGLKLQRKSR